MNDEEQLPHQSAEESPDDMECFNMDELGSGLTDGEAVKLIMKELENLLQQKEDYFKDQKEKRR